MAEARQSRRRAAPALPLPDTVALVLQGGGALGSFQAGVVEGLEGSGVALDWVAGISIGAINAALIAGNRPERRLSALRLFWERVTSALPSFPLFGSVEEREVIHEWSAGFVALTGVPGMFTPRFVAPQFAAAGSAGALSFYDSEPLRRTLDELVDWRLVNDGPTRLSVGAVEIESGNLHYFDSRKTAIDARHIMASAALPPGLPPVQIDGQHWWDGGLVSNTPLTHLLEHQVDEMLVFQVDLFPSKAELPRTLSAVVAREKEIRFSSRTRQISNHAIRLRQEQQAIRALLDKLPAELRNERAARKLAAMAAEKPLNLVHLIYRANPWEDGTRDFEFSTRTMHEHWLAGQAAVATAMNNSRIVAENIATGQSAAFDLAVKPDPLSVTKESA